ncbi:MAG: hypothetical protein CL946_02105 [Ectothiorhodospiraceae bacterium]|nr:hypothetical protein [Ectothiorhodospiraceae bacterium]
MRIYIVSTLNTYYDTIDIVRQNLEISGFIGLTDRHDSDAVSGYMNYAPYCRQHGITHIPVDNYSMRDEATKELLSRERIDLLLVVGWQRLIPDWLIEHSTYGAIGVHGSSRGITKGRGRSPQNWALILGHEQFQLSIFKIDPGIDSGSVIDTRTFSYDDHDDINTSYYKVAWLTGEMLVDCLSSGKIQRGEVVPQDDTPEYLPKRSPKHGAIDWRRSSREIFNFIRAQTRPYPGAFTSVSGIKCRIWAARPFALELRSNQPPGTVLKIYPNGDMIVQTGGGLLLVDDYSTESDDLNLETGLVFESADFREQMLEIAEAHQEKYPDLPLSRDILSLIC